MNVRSHRCSVINRAFGLSAQMCCVSSAGIAVAIPNQSNHRMALAFPFRIGTPHRSSEIGSAHCLRPVFSRQPKSSHPFVNQRNVASVFLPNRFSAAYKSKAQSRFLLSPKRCDQTRRVKPIESFHPRIVTKLNASTVFNILNCKQLHA